MNRQYTISLDDIHFYSHHGVFDQEHAVGAEFVVNLEVTLQAGIDPADQLEGTLSYADLYALVNDIMSEPVALLETVCRQIADRTLAVGQNIESGRVKVTKIAPPIRGIRGNASVTLTF